VGNRATGDFIEQVRQGADVGNLDPSGKLTAFLRDLEIVEAGEEYAPESPLAGEPEPVAVTLLLTSACNLRCRYCYAQAGEAPPEFMNLDTARRAIQYVVSNAARRGVSQLDLMFHGGGEPTVNWEVLTGSVEYARRIAGEFGLRLCTSMATNGVLSEEKLDWLCSNIHSASVSFDGLPSCQDETRLDVLGKGSSQRVMRSLRRFDAARLRYGIRLTVTDGQIGRLADSVEFIFSNFHPNGVQVEPVYQLGRWRDGPSAESMEFVKAFREAKDRARRYGGLVSFSGARVGLLTNHFCGVSRDAFSVAPSGNITGCFEVFSENRPWAERFFYARPDPNGGYEYNLPVLDNLRRASVEHKSHCDGCYARYTCAGDCTHKALELNGDVEFAGAGRCHVIRELTRDMILEKIEAAGGIAWHEGGLSRASAPAGCPEAA
jgi:uncharacterized protein